MTTSRPLALPLSAALLLAGCSAGLAPLPLGANVTCTTSADCPSGNICSPELSRCIPADSDDRDPPSLVASAISPSPARGGDTVTITFTVNEPLGSLPVVRFLGNDTPFGKPRASGLTYTLDLPILLDDTDVTRTVVARLVDLSGNVTEAAAVGQLTLDSTPPKATPQVDPDRAKVGDTLVVTLPFDEPLAGTPTMRFALGGASLAAELVEGNKWRFTRTLDGTEPTGTVELEVAAFDLAGNPYVPSPKVTAVLDFTPPTVASSTIHTPQVRAGDTFVGVVRFDEPLGDTPVVRLVPILGGLPIPVIASAIDATTWALSREIPAGEPDGDFELTLISGADRAGNPLTPGPLGPVSLDSTAPNVVALTVDHANATYRASDTVVVTFATSETLPVPPVVRLETIPQPRPFTCTALAARAWRCSVFLDGNERPESVVSVSVTAGDAAGNVATAATSVVLDFTPPSLLAGAPGRAAFPAGSRVTYLANVSEPLAAAPTLTVSHAGALVPAFFGAPASESATTFSWLRPVPTDADGAYLVTVSLVDEAGNTAGPVPATGFDVDTALPSVVGAVALAPAKAAFTAGDRPSVTFTVNEDLPVLTGVPTARLGTATPIDATCVGAGSARTFTCTLDRALTAADGPEGASALLITLSDAAGNVGYGSKALVLDYTPPALASAAGTQLIPGPGNLRTSISAVGPGSTMRLTVTSAEPLQAAPALVAFDAANGFQRSLSLVSQSGTTYVFDFTTGATTYPAATWQARWDPIDLAGNRWPAGARPVVASFQVDGEAPPAPTVGLPDAPMIVWHRTPWGTDLSPSPSFRLAGGPTSVIGGDLVVAWDGAAATAREVARGPASVDGFDLALPSDPPDLWLSTVDGAGNESLRERVVDVVWTAGLAGKVPGSSFENPNRLERRSFSTKALTQSDGVELAAAAVGVTGDGVVEATGGASAYRPVSGLTGPIGRRYYGFAADPGRGVLVLHGGQAQGGAYPSDTWEWDGAAWKLVVPEDPEGDGNPPSLSGMPMAYDPVRGIVVLLAHSLWSWNGRSWRDLEPGLGARPGYHDTGALAWDAARGVLVLFGGSYTNDTWEWNGSSWRQATLPGAAGLPPARSYHQLVWDPSRQKVLLYGGLAITGNTPLNDLWTWDGSSWTQLTGVVGSPGGRAMHAMAYDPNRQELVVQGGYTAGPVKDGKTWVLRTLAGVPTWTDVTPASGPLVFAEHQATWDQRGNGVVFFGDWTGTDLRRWEGAASPAWTPLAPGDPEGDGNPAYSSISSRGVMTYVAGRGVTVYHEANLRQTWEWNRASWVRKVNGTGATARSGASMGSWGIWSIMFGGTLFGSSIGDTWGWDGTSWTQLSASPARPVAGVHTNLFRENAAMVTDPNGNHLYRFGGYDQASFGIRCFSDIWEFNGAGWTLRGGEAWADPESDGSPLPYGVGVAVGDSHTCTPGRFTTWDPVRGTMLSLSFVNVVWEWKPATNSWVRHDFPNPPRPVSPRAFFYDASFGAPVALEDTGAWIADLATHTWKPLPLANPYGLTTPLNSILAFDQVLRKAVGLDQTPFTWESGTLATPAHLFTVDFSRANAPDPGVCVDRLACPIQRIDVRWTGGASSPLVDGAALQAWTGDWSATTGTSANPAAPALMTWSWLPTSPYPASSLFHGAARELTFQLVPQGPTTAAGTSQVATDAVSVTVHYRRE